MFSVARRNHGRREAFPGRRYPRAPEMARLLFSIYTTGIVVFLVLFLIFVPKIPLVDAIVAAL